MIVRVVTATVRTDRAGSFNALMRAQLPILRQHPGLVYVKLARRIDGNVQTVLLYEEWRDTAALCGWTGPEVTRPKLIPGAEELVSDVSVVHYEALDLDPSIDDIWGQGGLGSRRSTDPPVMGATRDPWLETGRSGAPGQRPGSTNRGEYPQAGAPGRGEDGRE